MKKIIVVVFVLISVNSYASSPYYADIPGWVEVDLELGYYTDLWGNRDVRYHGYKIVTKEIKVTYGGTLYYKDYCFEPYVFLGSKLFSTYKSGSPQSNNPFRNNYNAGFGLKFQNMFYFEFLHRCSHQVYTGDHGGVEFENNNKHYLLFEGYPTISFDTFRIGVNLKID